MTEPASEPTIIPTQDWTPPSDTAPAPADANTAPDQAEALATEAQGDHIAVPLCGAILYVPPTSTWRQSAMRALRSGNYDLWAEKVLSPKDFATFEEIDPTNGEVDAFFQDAAAKLGITPGNSSASKRS